MSANLEMRVSEDDLRAVTAMIRASGGFDPHEHPRYPKGFPQGGKFAPKGGADTPEQGAGTAKPRKGKIEDLITKVAYAADVANTAGQAAAEEINNHLREVGISSAVARVQWVIPEDDAVGHMLGTGEAFGEGRPLPPDIDLDQLVKMASPFQARRGPLRRGLMREGAKRRKVKVAKLIKKVAYAAEAANAAGQAAAEKLNTHLKQAGISPDFARVEWVMPEPGGLGGHMWATGEAFGGGRTLPPDITPEHLVKVASALYALRQWISNP
jgi:hypothetical protein